MKLTVPERNYTFSFTEKEAKMLHQIVGNMSLGVMRDTLGLEEQHFDVTSDIYHRLFDVFGYSADLKL